MDKRIIASIFLLVFDFLWIGLFMGRQYKTQVKNIQGKPMKTNIIFAVLAYTLMVVGMCLFVMPNIRDSHALIDSLTYGLTFGLVLYGLTLHGDLLSFSYQHIWEHYLVTNYYVI